MAVLAEPITRLVYERGAFGAEATDLTATAMVWWSISLPFQGVSLLFSRTFFSLQRPWATTALAGVNLVVNAGLAAALCGPFEIAGIVLGHRDGNHRDVRRAGLDPAKGARWDRGCAAALDNAADAGCGRAARAVAYFSWEALDDALGRSLGGQALSVLTADLAGAAAYAAAVWVLREPEARQIPRLLVSTRLG